MQPMRRPARPLTASRSRRSQSRTLRALGLGSGLAIAADVVAYLANHSPGVFSIDPREALLDVLRPVWRSRPGTVLPIGERLSSVGGMPAALAELLTEEAAAAR